MWSLKGIGSRGNHRNVQRQAVAAVCERLEGRQLLTAYTYRAEPNVDTITVVFENGYVKVRSNAAATILYPEATGMEIIGNAKNNVIKIDSSVKIPVVVRGGAGRDLIVGGGGDDLLMGEGGHDTLIPGGGNDTLLGGAGIDTADFSGFSENLDITIDDKPNDIIGERTANRFGDDIEIWLGGKGNDFIDASRMTTPVTIKGGNGNDTLWGGSGNDDLDGGAGLNALVAGPGKDSFVNWGTGKWTVTPKGVGGKSKSWRTASVYVDDGVLVVGGTAMDDKLSVTSVGRDWYVAVVNGTKWTFWREGIDSIAIYGGPGNDRITFAESGDPITAKMIAQGGAGKNTIVKPAPKDDGGNDGPVDPGTDGDSDGTDTEPPGDGTDPSGENDGSEQQPGSETGGPAEDPGPGEQNPGGDSGANPPSTGGTGGQGNTDGGGTIPVQPAPKQFVVYENTYFTNRPDLSIYGIQTPLVIGGPFFWRADSPTGGYDMNTPNEKATRNIARMASEAGQPLIIDIEHWPVDIRINSPAEVRSSIMKLSQIMDWVRDERPNVKLGIYGFGPLRDYWTPVQYWAAVENPEDRWYRTHLPMFESLYKKWQAANDFLKPLMDKVDYIVPSLFAFYDNTVDWVRYAKGNIEEAKRYGKPVIPFIWMDFHNSTPLMDQRVSAEFWQVQLETVYKMADGVVIWGGVYFSPASYGVAQAWNEQEPWWVVTKNFLAGLGQHP